MAKQQKPKRRGRPAKFGPRRNFNFRLSEKLHERLTDSAAKEGRSLSEELEMRINRDFAWEDAKGEIETMTVQAAAALDAARVQAIRAAGLTILREITGKPTRVILDLETLLAEADGIARGLRSGFVDDKAPSPTGETRPMTADEEHRLLEELEQSRRKIKEAMECTHGADAAAKGKGKVA
jgi:hypothetical protein